MKTFNTAGKCIPSMHYTVDISQQVEAAAGNHVEFIKFLGLLRKMYLNRDDRPTFQSVILAGVYDIKNLKLKLRPEDQHQYNSPWNIAVPLETNMSLPADGIAGMLAEYKTDHHLDFDEHFIGQMIYDYTSGYPFLVSRICQIIDEGGLTWDREGVLKAIDRLLIQSNALFWEILDIVDDYPQLKQKLGDMLEQQKIKCTSDEDFYIIGVSFGFLDKKNGIISCPIFESLFSMCLGVKKIS